MIMTPRGKSTETMGTLPRAPTGIQGLDEVTSGGLPRGRPTLICGGAGCGKTLLAMQFLVNGATRFDEPGVFVAFEETAEELGQNVASLGFDLEELCQRKMLAIDHVHVDRSEIEETGEYDLEGLFVRIGHAVDAIGARRVVIDTVETLFSAFSDAATLRAELRRLFRWLKARGLSAIITGERGEGQLTRHGLEEYVSDCVIVLDHRVDGELSTRRLRVVKYRGAAHGTNEYPFLIDEGGISVLPITSLGLDHEVSSERVSSGIPRLDTMLGGGVFRGSSVLVSGAAGTGKTSIAAHFIDAACARGERALLFSFEEAPAQIIRNMRSIGLDLGPWCERGLLHIHASRPTLRGLEAHLVTLHKAVEKTDPRLVVVDPVTNFIGGGDELTVNSMLMRFIDYLKGKHVTALFNSLTGGGATDQSEVGVSSLMDTWLLLRAFEGSGERNRGIYVLNRAARRTRTRSASSCSPITA
jgi:circadian clock protein KaiC